MKNFNSSLFLVCCCFGFLSACENEATTQVQQTSNEVTQAETIITETPQIEHIHTDSQFTIGNQRYLYDISEHSIEELQALLQRADEITQMGTENHEDLEIVMILHGPDIGWFTLDRYNENKELIDLAKKLDTYDIIDLKVCESSMRSLDIQRNQLPDFIESVPFAPNEVRRLTEDGYTHL